MLDVGIERLIAFRQRVEQRAALLLGVRAKGVLQRHEAAEPGRADLGAVVQARHRVIPDGHGLGLDVQQPTVVDHHHQRHDGQDDQEAGEDALAQSQILHAGDLVRKRRGPSCGPRRGYSGAACGDAGTVHYGGVQRSTIIAKPSPASHENRGNPNKARSRREKQSPVTTGLSFPVGYTEAGSPAPVLAPFNRPRAPSAAGPTPSPRLPVSMGQPQHVEVALGRPDQLQSRRQAGLAETGRHADHRAAGQRQGVTTSIQRW